MERGSDDEMKYDNQPRERDRLGSREGAGDGAAERQSAVVSGHRAAAAVADCASSNGETERGT